MKRCCWLYSLFAWVMLCAFCNMMLVKDFHHHECAHTHIQHGQTAFTEADDCPICHFTLVPQQAQITHVAVPAPQASVQLRCFFIQSYSTRNAEEPSSRGPPSC